MIRSILLPIDGSNYSESVLQYGLFLGQKLDAVLRIITIIDMRLFEWNMAAGADSFIPVVSTSEFRDETQQMLEKKADSILDKADEILSKSNLDYETQKITGIPVDEICAHSKSNDLLVLGVRGEYERWTSHLLGSTAEAVTRQVHKPMMLVDKKYDPFERIMCGYDGSESSNKSLQFAAFMAKTFNILLQVLTVINSDEEREEILAEAGRYLEPYRVEYQLRHEKGNAADVLINAQNSAPFPTLLNMGSYGHSRLREAILGSTTVQVMRKANKPILLAK